MSTETQTETIILQTRASTEAIPAEHDVAQDSRPEETKWMHAKLFSAGLSFFVAGVNDGSLGSIIPYVIYTYDVGTNMVAVLYGTTFCSWLIAALANGKITQYLDLGPILSLGAAVQVLAQVLRVWAPPFALYAAGWSSILSMSVTVMLKEMGYVPAGFYGGAFLGRLILAEPTHRLGERRMIFIYALLCMGLQLVSWLVPNIITEAVAVSQLGLFSGPFFATGISVSSKIFLPEIGSSAIAFVFALGQTGGSVFPTLTGIIAGHVGVQVLQPMLVGLLGAAD
ncbi:hypothetical protein PDIDSM_490 [Penicillium digitatum]|nr:hypothetical protein PDIDSM_490 [Penicillium digitatum]